MVLRLVQYNSLFKLKYLPAVWHRQRKGFLMRNMSAFLSFTGLAFSSSASEWWTLPGSVGQSEASPLEVDAAVHHQLSEQQRGVAWRPTWRILGRDPRWTSRGSRFGPGHELNDGQPGQPRHLLDFSLLLLRALRAQLTHGGWRKVKGQVACLC